MYSLYVTKFRTSFFSSFSLLFDVQLSSLKKIFLLRKSRRKNNIQLDQRQSKKKTVDMMMSLV